MHTGTKCGAHLLSLSPSSRTHLPPLPLPTLRCNTLQNTAKHCNTCTTLQRTATQYSRIPKSVTHRRCHAATHCNTLQHTDTPCNTPQHTAIEYQRVSLIAAARLQHVSAHVNTRRHTAPHCITMYHTAIHCKLLQHNIKRGHSSSLPRCNTLQHAATRCNTLKYAVTHCNALQYTATRCNTLSKEA